MNILKKPITLECENCFALTRALEKFDPTDDGMGICKDCFAEVVQRHGYGYAVGMHGLPGVNHSLSIKDELHFLIPDQNKAPVLTKSKNKYETRLHKTKTKYAKYPAIVAHAEKQFEKYMKGLS